MGLTRACVSAKLDELPILLLDTLCRDMLPFTLTRSAALNMSLHGLIAVLPGSTMQQKVEALQGILRNCRNEDLPEPQRVLSFMENPRSVKAG